MGPHTVDLKCKRGEGEEVKTKVKMPHFPEQTEPVKCEQ